MDTFSSVRSVFTPRGRAGPQGAEQDGDAGDDQRMGQRRATTAADASTGANTVAGTGNHPAAGGGTRTDLLEEVEAADLTSLGDDEVKQMTRLVAPDETQDATWQAVSAQQELTRLPELESTEDYEELEPDEALELARRVLKIELHLVCLEVLEIQISAAVSPAEKYARECLARLRGRLEEDPVWCRLLTAERPMGKIRRWARLAARSEFDGLLQSRRANEPAQASGVNAARAEQGGSRFYLRSGEQAPAVANFPRTSNIRTPTTEEALVLLAQFDTTRLLTGEDGLTLRNVQHAAVPNAWLASQYSSWTRTLLPPLQAAGKTEAECVLAFFEHVQKMFNVPNLFRLSLTQLKAIQQDDLIAGSAFVLRFMQARITTMQLAQFAGRTQWEFSTEQACGL